MILMRCDRSNTRTDSVEKLGERAKLRWGASRCELINEIVVQRMDSARTKRVSSIIINFEFMCSNKRNQDTKFANTR